LRRARAAAEDRAKQEAVSRVMNEHKILQNAQSEVDSKVQAELKARAQAEREADMKERLEAQKRADVTGAQRSIEAELAAAKGATMVLARKPVKWARTVGISAAVVLVTAIAILQMAPLSAFIPGVQKILSERVQEPVNIGDLRFSMFPFPQIKIERLLIGKAQDIRIDTVTVPLTSFGVFGERKQIDEVDVGSIAMDQYAIARVAGWAQTPASDARLHVRTIKIDSVKLTLPRSDMPSFAAVITLANDGGWQKAVMRDSKLNVELLAQKQAGQFQANFSARNWQPPSGLKFEFTELSGSAMVTPGQAIVSNVEGRLFGGSLKGAVTFKWADGLAADGDFIVEGADVSQVLSAYTRDFLATGMIDTKLKFSAKGQTPEDIFRAPRISATFAAQKGVVNNVDLVRAIQSASRSPQRGGKTVYSEISGEVQVAGGRITYRNVKLSAGPLNATGSVDVGAGGEVAGRLYAQLGTPAMSVARAALHLSGAIKDPVLNQ